MYFNSLNGSESWIILNKHVNWITEAEITNLRKSVEKTRRDRIRNAQIRNSLVQEPVTNIIEIKGLR